MSASPDVSPDQVPWSRATGRKVRGQLAEHERSQADAAAVLGLSQAAVSRRLIGDVDFTITELITLSIWLGVHLTDLLPTVLVEVTGQGPATQGPGRGFISACSSHDQPFRARHLHVVTERPTPQVNDTAYSRLDFAVYPPCTA